jgi:hypothetical protein
MLQLFKTLLSKPLSASELREKAEKVKSKNMVIGAKKLIDSIDNTLIERSEQGVKSGIISVYSSFSGYILQEGKLCTLTYVAADADILKVVTAKCVDEYRSRGYDVTVDRVEREDGKFQIITIAW